MERKRCASRSPSPARERARKSPAVLRRAQADRPSLADLPAELLVMVVCCAGQQLFDLMQLRRTSVVLEHMVRHLLPVILIDHGIIVQRNRRWTLFDESTYGEPKSHVRGQPLAPITEEILAHRSLREWIRIKRKQAMPASVSISPREKENMWMHHPVMCAYDEAARARPGVFTHGRRERLFRCMLGALERYKPVNHLAKHICTTVHELAHNGQRFGLVHQLPRKWNACCQIHEQPFKLADVARATPGTLPTECLCRHLDSAEVFYYALLKSQLDVIKVIERKRQIVPMCHAIGRADMAAAVDAAYNTLDGQLIIDDISARLAHLAPVDGEAALGVLLSHYEDELRHCADPRHHTMLYFH